MCDQTLLILEIHLKSPTVLLFICNGWMYIHTRGWKKIINIQQRNNIFHLVQKRNSIMLIYHIFSVGKKKIWGSTFGLHSNRSSTRLFLLASPHSPYYPSLSIDNPITYYKMLTNTTYQFSYPPSSGSMKGTVAILRAAFPFHVKSFLK
jgi:hypothetical protein